MSATLELDLSVLLPGAPDEGDGCITRLSEALARTAGVEEAHVIAGEEDGSARMCLHYDRDALTVTRLRELAFRAGAEITDRFGHVVWQVGGLGRPRRAETITAALQRVPGVLEARAWADGPLRVEFDREQVDEERLRGKLSELGVWTRPADELAGAVPDAQAAPSGEDHRHGAGGGHDHDHGGLFGEKSELVFALACGAFLGIGVRIVVHAGRIRGGAAGAVRAGLRRRRVLHGAGGDRLGAGRSVRDRLPDARCGAGRRGAGRIRRRRAAAVPVRDRPCAGGLRDGSGQASDRVTGGNRAEDRARPPQRGRHRDPGRAAGGR